MTTSAQRALLIIGGGGHGRVIADLAEATGSWTSVGFLDDNRAVGRTPEGWTVEGPLAALRDFVGRYSAVAIGLGNAERRLEIAARAESLGFELPILVHPRATVSRRATLGPGSVVCAGAVVCVGAGAGRACIVNTGATVDHDCELADGVHICPGAHVAGTVVVGPRSWIGVGSTVRQNIRIGRDVLVAAGAVVVSDIADGIRVAGVPARRMPS